MTSWVEPRFVEPHATLIREAGHPLLAKVLIRRGIEAPAAARAFIDADAYAPAPPSELPDLSVAATHLREIIQKQQEIFVWGDFDVDGQTATSLLVSALRELGATVRSYIPDRLREGHGIRLESLKNNLASASLLLTCDTGISEHEAIDYAMARGVATLVTDHHDLPAHLPLADALVNPKRLADGHPLRDLPGVGVAFKLIQELHRVMGRDAGNADVLLDLVALGIVADLATQKGDTRYLLQRGMKVLRSTSRLGLQALMQTANLRPDNLTTDHIGFVIGPRLNALGRLGDANLAVELLTTQDWSRARILAAQLEGLNGRRRLLTEQTYASAQHKIHEQASLLDTQALVVSGRNWHPGIIGIVASRLSETYHRPCVVISEGEDADALARGSARSVPGLHINEAISAVAPLLITHGGHAGAAGLRLLTRNIDAFRAALSREVDTRWDRTAAAGLQIDAYVDWSEPTLELVDTLNRLAPFGEGNPPVILASKALWLAGHQVFGRDEVHRRLTVRDADQGEREVIWWRGTEHPLPKGKFDLAYVLKSSDYRGVRQLQIEYRSARAVETPSVLTEVPSIQVFDHRADSDPGKTLEATRQSENTVVWAEGYAAKQSPGVHRLELGPASSLLVWTPPPGPSEWRVALERVSPDTVHLFAVTSGGTEPERFLPTLAGMLKYTLRYRRGVADLARIAAISGQRLLAVREGIRLLAARGDIRILEEGPSSMHIARGDGVPTFELDEIRSRLEAVLQETAAYRTFFGHIPAEQLVQTEPQ
jgi:single-stranded-DNA-specific exonuclease